MKRKETADLLAACLDDIRAGRLTMDECLSAHSRQAEALRPLIETALSIRPPRPVDLDPDFRLRGRTELIEAITADEQAAAAEVARPSLRELVFGRHGPLLRPAASGIRLTAMALSILLVLAAALGGGATYASGNSLPGDFLYPVKITVEMLQVSLATDDEAKARAYAACAAVRAYEAQRAVAVERDGAAGAAAELYSRCVSQAETHLSKAANSGTDVTGLADRLADDLGRQLAVLEEAAERTKGHTWEVLDMATQDARRVQETATVVAQGHRTASVPETTRSPAVPREPPGQGPGGGPGRGRGEPEPAPGTTVGAAQDVSQMVSDVRRLGGDRQDGGQSFRGLQAKLEAAMESLLRNRTDAAIHELDAFLKELNALRRSGQITIEDYDNLYAGYSQLVTKLGGTPGARGEASRPEEGDQPSRSGPSDGRGRQPEDRPDSRGPGRGEGEAEDRPDSRGPGRGEDQPEDRPDNSGPGRGEDEPEERPGSRGPEAATPSEEGDKRGPSQPDPGASEPPPAEPSSGDGGRGKSGGASGAIDDTSRGPGGGEGESGRQPEEAKKDNSGSGKHKAEQGPGG